MENASVRKAEHLDEAQPPTRPPLSLRAPQLFAIFAVEAIAIEIARLPVDMSFSRFAFFDYGANLTLQSLISQGYRPAIDFGITYGLLGILIGKAWFGCFGLTPLAYQWAMLTGAILFAWALARIFAERKIGAAGLALLIVSFGFAYQSSYPSLTHCVEAVVLAHALAAQVRGSYRGALALATVEILDKPSMGYIYGALLLMLIVLEIRRESGTVSNFIGVILPAAIVFMVLSMVLISIYGVRSFLVTIVPIEGVINYRTVRYGFISGGGKYLWNLSGRVIPYFLDVPGYWMASTLYLLVAAVVQTASLIRRRSLTRAGELIVTCAILHFSFVFLFFGPSVSWYYYSFLLAIGCGLTTEMGAEWRRAAVLLCVLATLSWYTPASAIYTGWKSTSPNPETAGLWSLPGEASEWNKVVEMARHEKMVVIDIRGGVELMYPEFGKPVALFLSPGLMTEGDVTRTAARLSTADSFVVPGVTRLFDGLPDAPEITAAIGQFELEWKGYFFEVYRRRTGKIEE
jgi:hypothetical protein